MCTNKFEKYQDNSKYQFSPRIAGPRTNCFSAIVSNRKDLQAADYSVISGLNAENGLLNQELNQLRKVNK